MHWHTADVVKVCVLMRKDQYEENWSRGSEKDRPDD